MKPDMTDKKENLEEEYQRPPLREEIEKFFREAKMVISFVALGVAVFSLITIRDSVARIIQTIVQFVVKLANSIAVEFLKLLEILAEFLKNHPEKVNGAIYTTLLLVLCYYLITLSLTSRYYIYKRFRIGHFSKMMWSGIAGLIVQLFIFGFSVYFGVVVFVVLVDVVLVFILFKNLTHLKKIRPSLSRPLTKQENEKRSCLINGLYAISAPYKLGYSNSLDWERIAENMARLALISDVYPEELDKIFFREYLSDYSVYQSIEAVYNSLFKNEDLYPIYYAKAEQATKKMQYMSELIVLQRFIFLDYFE